MTSCFKNPCTRRDAHPFFGEVILRERNIHEGNMLRQHYLEPPPKSLFYDIVTKAQTMKLKKIIPLAFGITFVVICVISLLYVVFNCSTESFDNLFMSTFLQIVGAGSSTEFCPNFICRSTLAFSTL